jgi:hypothetical protein
MAYKPNPDRKVVNGKAVVSAKELADFQAERGSDKTLRDLLNADKGLSRAPELDVNKPRNPSVKDGSEVQHQGATYPKKEAASKPKADDSGPSEMVKGFRAARDKFGDTPFVDALMSAGKAGIAMEGGKLLGPAGRTIGAIVKKEFGEDGLLPTFNRAEDPRPTTFSTLKPENQAVSRQYREAYDDRPGPMKKGGAVKPYTKGGKINLGACGVSTHVPSKKNSNW